MVQSEDSNSGFSLDEYKQNLNASKDVSLLQVKTVET